MGRASSRLGSFVSMLVMLLWRAMLVLAGVGAGAGCANTSASPTAAGARGAGTSAVAATDAAAGACLRGFFAGEELDPGPEIAASDEALERADLEAALAAADELERRRAFAPLRRELAAVMAAVVAAPGGLEIATAAALRLCAAWQLEGAPAAARRCYLEAARCELLPEPTAVAAYRAATLALTVGDEATARAELLALIRRAPTSAGAARALAELRALAREEGGAEAEIAVLEDVVSWPELTSPDGGAGSLWLTACADAARLLLAAGDAARALAQTEQAAPRAAGTRAADELLFWRARALRQLGRLREAATAYEELCDAAESSWFVGSYESPYRDDALYELGDVLQSLGKSDEARAAFQRLLAETPTSRLRDDAAFRDAALAYAAGDPAPLGRFVQDYPESRHIAQARALLGGAGAR